MWPMDPLLNTYNVENFTWKEITDFFQLLREDVNQDNIEIFVTAFYQKLRRSLELRKSQKYYLIGCVLLVSAQRSPRFPYTNNNVINTAFQDGTTLRSNTLLNDDLLSISGRNRPFIGLGNDHLRYQDQSYVQGDQARSCGITWMRLVEMWTQWEHGSWSEWYVPGMNDIDNKFNVQTAFCRDYEVRANSMRRGWAYFNKYTYIVILCEDERKQISEE